MCKTTLIAQFVSVGTQGFCKGYYKVQMDEQVYMTLQTVKQRPSGVNEEILGMNF